MSKAWCLMAMDKKSISFVVLLLLCCSSDYCYARSRRNNQPCNDEQQKKMQAEFTQCVDKFTKEHHEASGKATTPQEYQKYTCKLLSDTWECGALWKRCHSPAEVRNIQDMHTQARINQFRDNKEGIDVFKCPVVEEYINSGRADRIDQSTEGACTVTQVSEVQQDFQKCSHNKSLDLYEKIQALKDRRFSRDTNDLESELNREDSEEALDPLKDVKPHLCSTLKDIAKDCIESFNKCFSSEDAEVIKRQHIEQMQKYYTNIYEGVGDLKDCPDLAFLNQPKKTYDDYEDEYHYEDDYEDTDYYEQDNSKEKTSSSSTTTTERIEISDDELESREEDSLAYPDDPEGNAVIAEPPSFIGADYSKAASGPFSLSWALFVLCWSLNLVLIRRNN